MNRLEKETISRIAMVVMAILLLAIAAGILVLAIAIVHDMEAYRTYQANHYGFFPSRPAWQSGYQVAIELLILALVIAAASVYLLVGCFRPSVNTEREPDDPRYRIK